MQVLYRSFLVLIGLMFVLNVDAFHIVGGELTYECLGYAPGDSTERSYRFEMRVYRDCAGQGANFDMPAEMGIYREVNGVYTFVRVFNTNPISITTVPPPDDPCLIIPDNVCVEEGIYEFNVNLEIIEGSYHIFWRRCCRNSGIQNIIDPRNTGATYTVEITSEAQKVCNISPRFKGFPPTVICVNNPLNFDHSATDAEGDQLVYEFCAPLTGGGPAGGSGAGSGDRRGCDGIQPNPVNCPPPFTPVVFVGPKFTASTPLGGSPEVNIDANTGRITGVPKEQGQFVVGVCVKEYRNGELLSVLRRDFQFNVSICEIAVEADIASDTALGGQQFVINSCGESTVTFVNLSEKQENIKNYRWIFNINGADQFNFNRDATVTFPGVGEYQGLMIINEGLACADTADIRVNVYPDIDSDFEFDYDTCFGSPVQFVDKSITGSGEMREWQWDFGVGAGSQLQNPNYLYPEPGDHLVSLHVTDVNHCTATATKSIPYYPVPAFLVVEPSTFVGCAPSTINFTNLSVPIDSTYDIFWDFGDGNISNEISPSYTYTEPGVYSVNVDITSPIGCNIKKDFPNWISVKNSPQAGFEYSPDRPTSFNPTVAFADQSIDANAWQWTFGTEGTAFDRNPTFTFQDTGLKVVQQVVYRENGCTDTAYAQIDVIPEVTYHLPNAFTPNNDSKNDIYKGKGILTGVRDFNMTIWSRWGELVFESSDPDEGWNGRMRNNGEEMPMGVYVCKVSYLTPRDQVVQLEEFATLIR